MKSFICWWEKAWVNHQQDLFIAKVITLEVLGTSGPSCVVGARVLNRLNQTVCQSKLGQPCVYLKDFSGTCFRPRFSEIPNSRKLLGFNMFQSLEAGGGIATSPSSGMYAQSSGNLGTLSPTVFPTAFPICHPPRTLEPWNLATLSATVSPTSYLSPAFSLCLPLSPPPPLPPGTLKPFLPPCLPVVSYCASHCVSHLLSYSVSHFVAQLLFHCVSHLEPWKLCCHMFPTLFPSLSPGLSPTVSPPLCLPLCPPPCFPLCSPLCPLPGLPFFHLCLPRCLPPCFWNLVCLHLVSKLVSHCVHHLVSHCVAHSVFYLVFHCVWHFVWNLETLFATLCPTLSPSCLLLCLPLCLPPSFPACLPLCLPPETFVSQLVPHCVCSTLSPTLFPILCLPPCLPPRFPLCFPLIQLPKQGSARLLPPFPTHVFQWSLNCFPLATQWSLVSKRLPLVTELSRRCLPDVVSQMLSPSCLQGFSTCCLVVVHLSRNRGWSPHCLPVVSPSSPTCFPDAVSELSPNFISQFPAVSQNLSYHWLPYCFQIPAICHPMLSSDVVSYTCPQLSRACLADVVFQLSPLALNLEQSLRLTCNAGLILKDNPSLPHSFNQFCGLLVFFWGYSFLEKTTHTHIYIYYITYIYIII